MADLSLGSGAYNALSLPNDKSAIYTASFHALPYKSSAVNYGCSPTTTYRLAETPV